jgi:hypothetical protein
MRPVILRNDQFEDLKFYSRREQRKADMAPSFPMSDPIPMH